MANLAVSAVCNQSCAYCFTVDHLRDGRRAAGNGEVWPDGEFLALGAFQERLDFLTRSAIHEVRLLGGEPTLHPQFVELVERARAADMKVVVFSNGLMPEEALACLEALSPEGCSVLVNVNQPAAGLDRADQRPQQAMRRLGQRAMPGFNIHRPDFRPDFLLPLIADTGCKPAIRLGMAQPCLSGDNRHLYPNQYRAVAVKIVKFARAAAGAGVSLDFDCGFVRCVFSDDDLVALRAAGANIGYRCSPILDIDLHGDVIHCYPLSRLASLPLTPDVDAATLRSTFVARTQHYRQAGVFRECSGCPFKASGECPGGCLAATIRRFRHSPFQLQVPGEVVA